LFLTSSPPAPYGWYDGAAGDKEVVDTTAAAGRCSPLLFRCFGRCFPAAISLVSARRGSPKSEQLHGFERQRESEFGAGTANVAKALWL
jgi:hypothetical protein